jgi:hypothetical protein
MIKKDHIVVFLVIIALVLGVIFYFNNPSEEQQNTLEYTAGCSSDKVDVSVYSLKGDTSLIGAFVSFKKIPISPEIEAELIKLGVALEEDSWIFDYALARIPTSSLCVLAEYDFVKSIFIPQTD